VPAEVLVDGPAVPLDPDVVPDVAAGVAVAPAAGSRAAFGDEVEPQAASPAAPAAPRPAIRRVRRERRGSIRIPNATFPDRAQFSPRRIVTHAAPPVSGTRRAAIEPIAGPSRS
jgi:hypothetical protein